MYRMDYHVHTNHSIDGLMTMEALCEASIANGLDEICITEHTDFGHPVPEVDAPPNMDNWYADIARVRALYPKLTIRAGLEIGDNPRCREAIKPWHFSKPLDFRLLSLHLVDNVDPYQPEFYQGREQSELYRRYVECKLESALAWDPDTFDAIAHLGYCAKFAPYPAAERPLRLRHAPEALDALLSYLAQNGKALEINTSGMRTMGECIPDREILERFKALGGEFITIGSDAHRTEDVGRYLDDACAMAKSCGIRYAVTFEQRRPIPVLL